MGASRATQTIIDWETGGKFDAGRGSSIINTKENHAHVMNGCMRFALAEMRVIPPSRNIGSLSSDYIDAERIDSFHKIFWDCHSRFMKDLKFVGVPIETRRSVKT